MIPRSTRSTFALVFFLAAVTGALPAGARESATSAAVVDFERDWIVSPKAGRELIQQGALVIDARGADLKKKGALPNAAPVEWQDLSEPNLPTKGRLLSDAKELDRRLQALGLIAERPVVVVADPVNGWGEDGRIAWALRTFGHRKVVIVDGGLPALQNDGALTIAPPVVPGTFHARFDTRWHVQKEEIKTHLGRGDLALLDVREPREYAGKTPYGEARGGHIPGAKGLWYKDLIGKDGKLLPRADIEKVLASKGITRDSNIVAYCTGGIRSGWFTTVLNDLGYKARNYPGSGWEWGGSPAAEYPLVKD
jgi:thiosulfate/3-mercaptopyruvate sulfurtransferase